MTSCHAISGQKTAKVQTPAESSVLTLASLGSVFQVLRQFGEGGGAKQPLAVRPLIEIARRDKDEHVSSDGRKLMISNFKIFGYLVASQVLVNDRKWPYGFSPITLDGAS